RRAGLDYWPRLAMHEHAGWTAYRRTPAPGRWLFSTRGRRSLFDAELRLGDHLVFGSEGSGLPSAILDAHPDRCLALPMAANERSLNVATAVCAVVYEGLRQLERQRVVASQPDLRLRPGASWPTD
ncbi:MAG: TrmH family RNA methyltransferase, partial [Planctomycetota bacterium]